MALGKYIYLKFERIGFRIYQVLLNTLTIKIRIS